MTLPVILLALGLQKSAGPDQPGVAEVVRVLERFAPREQESEASLARELGGLGPAAAPALFEVLARGAGEHATTAPEEQAILAALVGFGTHSLRALLQERLDVDPPAPAEERGAALRLLARFATDADLALLRRAAAGACAGFTDALQEAVARLVCRDPRALEGLRRWMLAAPEALATTLAHGTGDSACPLALPMLAGTLGYRAELDEALLEEIGRLAELERKPIEEEILAPLEEALAEGDAGVLRLAALALGHARATSGVAGLIPLLAHETSGVRVAVQWSLERITGLRLGSDPQRWSAWLLTEQRWFEREGERLQGELRSAAPEVAIRALGELSSHAWRRHELALETVEALAHASPAVRRLACLTLARLDSSAAIPALELAREDEDEAVVQAALQALQVVARTPPAACGGATAP